MWRRTVLVSIIILVLLIIAGAILLYLQSNQNIETLAPTAGIVNENTDTTQNTNSDSVTTGVDDKQSTTIEPKQTVSLESQVRLFVEKYGTYSSDYPYKNLQSVIGLVTDNYAATIQIVVEQGLANIIEEPPFYSVITKVLSINQIKNDGAQAEVEILTQRSESFSRTDEPIVSYRKIVLNLKMVDEKWLISSAKWLTE